MANTDPETERNRLREYYSSRSEEELRRLADNAGSLTDLAKDVLQGELSRRGLSTELHESIADNEQLPGPVIIREFRDMPEALLAKSILDSAGIESILFNENMIRMDWLWSNALGGIRLVVKNEDAQASLELLDQQILETFDVAGEGNYKQPHCPRCDSLNVSFGGKGKRLAYATVAVGVPLPVRRGGWKCGSCGHEWNESEEPQRDEERSPI